MEDQETPRLAGAIELFWPGKRDRVRFAEGRWRLEPYGKTETHRALMFDSAIGGGERTAGYAVKADIVSALDALRTHIPAHAQLFYFDTPRLNVFQSAAEPGYATSTWLSLLRAAAQKALRCMRRKGFFAAHTDEQMAHHARCVLDEVFGGGHYVGTFVWQKQYGPQNDHNVPTDVLDYIAVYSKTPAEVIDKIGLLVTPQDLKDDGDFRGCYIDGHKGARSGSEATKFRINPPPYHWEIVQSDLPQGQWYFDKILGVLYFGAVESAGEYSVTVKATDRKGDTAEKTISFRVRESAGANDAYAIPKRIWWLMKEDNDIVKGGKLSVCDLPDEELEGVKGQEFSLVFKVSGGEPHTMRFDAPGVGRYWEFGKRTLSDSIARAMASFGSAGTALPSIKKYFDRANAKKRQAVMNFLPWYDFGHTQDATQHCKALRNAGITSGEINMMAKPQKLLAHLIQLLAPGEGDLVVSLGETNGVFASVAMKLRRRFIHVTGGSKEELETWERSASKRLAAVMQGKDTAEVEVNDSLPDANPIAGRIDVLRLSKSCLTRNVKSGDVEPHFCETEDIADFYAGLAGTYRTDADETAYNGIDGKTAVVILGDEVLDNVLLERIKNKYKSGNIVVVYESVEGDVKPSKRVYLRNAPLELI